MSKMKYIRLAKLVDVIKIDPLPQKEELNQRRIAILCRVVERQLAKVVRSSHHDIALG